VEHERTEDRKRIAAAWFALAAKSWEKGQGSVYFSSQITDRSQLGRIGEVCQEQ
jgi:hypothetical protein